MSTTTCQQGSPAREKVLNSRVSIYQQPKQKSNKRKALNDTYLSKFERQQEEKKEKVFKLIAEEFERNWNLQEKSKQEELDDSENIAMQKRMKAMIR